MVQTTTDITRDQSSLQAQWETETQIVNKIVTIGTSLDPLCVTVSKAICTLHFHLQKSPGSDQPPSSQLQEINPNIKFLEPNRHLTMQVLTLFTSQPRAVVRQELILLAERFLIVMEFAW